MPESDVPICSPIALPADLVLRAAEIARRLNPANEPYRDPRGVVHEPYQLAMLTSSYFGAAGVDLTVGFTEPTPADLAARILAHMSAWGERANVRFTRTKTDPMVRITRGGGGYWSFLGTDLLAIPKGRPTMCLQGFTMRTPEAEFRRVVRHETGHSLGLVHEHMRKEIVALLDERKTLAYFSRTQGWSEQMIRANVLTPLDPSSVRASRPDETSVMAYQISGECTYTGKPIVGGSDINEIDHEFIATLYPKPDARKPLTPDEIFKRIQGIF